MSSLVASSASSWYYDGSSTIHIDENNHRVGVNVKSPAVELQVLGTTKTDALIVDDVFTFNNSINFHGASLSNLSNVVTSNANVVNNLAVNNINFSSVPYITGQTSNFPTISLDGTNLWSGDAKIDYNTWIKNGPYYSNDGSLQTRVLSILGSVLGGAATVATLTILGREIFGSTGNFGKDAQNELQDLLNQDSSNLSGQSNKLSVNWKNVTNRCFYNNHGSEQVAFGNNVYIATNSQLCGITTSSLHTTTDFNGQTIKYIDFTPTTYTVFDFNTKELFCNKVTCANTITASNQISTT